MGQIRGRSAKPDACNIRSLSSFGTPAAGQHILVSTDNSAMRNGQGNFDAYVVGDGTTAATELPLKSIVGLLDRSLEQFLIEEYDGLLTHTTIKRFSYASNYSLVGDGHWVSNSGFICEKFNVTGGSLLKVKLAKDSAGVYQFQTTTSNPTASGSTANIVEVGNYAVDGYLRVPDNAVCLVVSRASSTTTNSIELIEPAEQDNFPSSDSGHLITSRGVAEGIIVGGMKADQIDADYHQYKGQISAAGTWLDNAYIFYVFPVKSGQHIVMQRSDANIIRSYLKTFAGQPTTGYQFDQSSVTGYSYSYAKTFNEYVPNDSNYLLLMSNDNALPASLTIDGYDMLTGIKEKVQNIGDTAEKVSIPIELIKRSIVPAHDLNKNYGWQRQLVKSALDHVDDGWLHLRAVGSSTWSFEADNIFNTGLYVVKGERTDTGTSSAATARFELPLDLNTVNFINGKYIQVCVELFCDYGYMCAVYTGTSSTSVASGSDYNWRGGKKIVNMTPFVAELGTANSQRNIAVVVGQYVGHPIYIGRIEIVVLENSTAINLPYTNFGLSHSEQQKAIESINGTSADIVETNNPALCYERFRQTSKIADVFTLAFFSDIHGDSVNYNRYKEFAGVYQEYISCKLHGGDIVQYNSSNDFTFWDDPSILNTIGNHDVQDANGEYTLTEADAYNKYFAPFIANWGVTYTEGKCYYYKDFTKVRLIVLDVMFPSTDQLSFLTSALAGAKTAGLSVVICEHYPIAINMAYQRDSAWCSAKRTSEVGIPTTWKSAVNDFITSGGDFVAWLCGHTHFDILAHDETYTNQWCIAVGTARGSNVAGNDYSRQAGTQSQDLFNIISIDATNGLLTMWRVGAQADKYLRVHEPMCLDYRNGEIL